MAQFNLGQAEGQIGYIVGGATCASRPQNHSHLAHQVYIRALPALHDPTGLVTTSLSENMETGGCSQLGLTPYQCALAALDGGERDVFAQCLKEEGLDIDFDPNPRVGKSLLREALRRGNEGAVQELLRRGVSIHLDKTASKLTPIHLAVRPGSGISDETIKQMLLRLVALEVFHKR